MFLHWRPMIQPMVFSKSLHFLIGQSIILMTHAFKFPRFLIFCQGYLVQRVYRKRDCFLLKLQILVVRRLAAWVTSPTTLPLALLIPLGPTPKTTLNFFESSMYRSVFWTCLMKLPFSWIWTKTILLFPTLKRRTNQSSHYRHLTRTSKS